MCKKPQKPFSYWETVKLRLMLVATTAASFGCYFGIWRETEKSSLIGGTLAAALLTGMFLFCLFVPLTKDVD